MADIAEQGFPEVSDTSAPQSQGAVNMNIQSIKYQTGASGAPFSNSSFATLAPNLIDGAVGDTATGYTFPTPGLIAAIMDMGTTNLVPVTGVETALPGTFCGGTLTLSYSSDGVNWLTAYSTTSVGGSQSPTFTGQAARYWQLAITNSFNGNSFATLSDFRLYSNGTLITVPPAAAVAPAAPTLGATATGSPNLPVNTQALTTNATSEVIQVTTDAGGTLPISGSPFTVPTPGTAINVPLTNGNRYYLFVGMVNSSGTTYGPSLPVNFDTAGPTFPPGSATISGANGNVLTITASDFSPPLTAIAAAGTLTMSGGAATLSAFVVSGGTITATISRSVLGGETGTLAIPAGAFGDSAVPTTNANSAAGAFAVTNNSGVASPPPISPAAPGVLSVQSNGALLAVPAYTANTARYDLQYAVDANGTPGNFNTIGPNVPPSANAQVNGLTSTTGGYFRLLATGAGGTSAGASTAKVVTLPGVERSTLFQGIQIGVETVAGLIVPATKRFISLQADPEPIIPVKTYRPYGNKSFTVTQSGQEMTEMPFTGVLDFNSIIYLLASQIGIPAAPIPLGGGAYQWNFVLNETQPATPQTYSCESGGAQGASRFGYAYIPDLEQTFAKEEASCSGKIQGQAIQDNISLTNGVPELPAVAMPFKNMYCAYGTTPTSLQKLFKVISWKITMNGHWVPQFYRDNQQLSFSGVSEKAPDYMWEIVNTVNSDTDALLAGLRNDQIFYLASQINGAIITPGIVPIYYYYQVIMPVKVQVQPTREDHDSVYGATYKFVGAHDPVFGAVQATVINKISAL